MRFVECRGELLYVGQVGLGCRHEIRAPKDTVGGDTEGVAGGPPGDRTRDTLIKSQVLYH